MFAKLTTEQEYTRTVAGLILKNNIKSFWNDYDKELVQGFIKRELLTCTGDPSPAIRRTLSSIITTIITKEKIEVYYIFTAHSRL